VHEANNAFPTAGRFRYVASDRADRPWKTLRCQSWCPQFGDQLILRRSPLMDVIRDLAQEMKGYESEMGFTPASRSRVQMPQESVDTNDPWAEIAG